MHRWAQELTREFKMAGLGMSEYDNPIKPDWQII
jgi:hypothetical protein